MKYCGMTFNKFKSTGRMLDNQYLNSPYEALQCANEKWENENEEDKKSMRLLVVICFDEQLKHTKTAFFQFKNFNSCETFAKSEKNIVWSEEGKEAWNGNICIMGKPKI